MDLYQVAEMFVSINGEGIKSGQLAMFVRLKGCNLQCSYCDTAWANDKAAKFEWMSKEDIYAQIKESGVRNITLTGGEPLLQEGIASLIDFLLRDSALMIEVETNGSVSIAPWHKYDERLSFTVDYKSPGSGMQQYMDLENYQYLKKTDTVKFVCGSKADLEQAKKIMTKHQLTNRCHVILSPVFGEIEPIEIVAFMSENRLNQVQLQLQLHKLIWDPDKRGV